MNGGEGHYEEMITGSRVRVISDTFLPQERLCFVENRKGRKKNHEKLQNFFLKPMAELRPIQYFNPAPFQQTVINQTFAFLLIELHFWFAGNEKPWLWFVMVLSCQRHSWYHSPLSKLVLSSEMLSCQKKSGWKRQHGGHCIGSILRSFKYWSR